MSQGLNRTSIIGYLGRNPEGNDSGTVTRFSVGVTERWRTADGDDKEHTEWFRVVAFNSTVAACKEFLSRGRRVYVEGRLRTRTYTNRDGEERTATELLAQSVIFLDGPRSDDDREDPRARPGKPRDGEVGNSRDADGLTADDPPF
jgi:single-strand DNA-binding protein